MLMKDDDVSKAGGHSQVECEERGIPLNDTNQDTSHTSSAGKKTAYPPKQGFHSIHTIFLHDPAWLELAGDCIMR